MMLIDYKDLFDKDFGASDFITITKNNKVIFVANWVKTHLTERNKMRRIILFIDEVYNHKTKLFVLSEGGLEDLFIRDDLSDGEESFMINRCVSRLNEMMSLSYIKQ